MQSFAALNKKKIPTYLMRYAAIYTAFLIVVVLGKWLVNGVVPGIKITFIVLSMGIGCAVFIFAISYMAWSLGRRARIKALKIKPFDQLNEIGFTTINIGSDSQWDFTEEAVVANILRYNIQFNVNRAAPKKVEFLIYVYHSKFNRKEYKRLIDKFKKEDLFFGSTGIIKKYDIRKVSHLTIGQLEKELIHVLEELKAERFEPIEVN